MKPVLIYRPASDTATGQQEEDEGEDDEDNDEDHHHQGRGSIQIIFLNVTPLGKTNTRTLNLSPQIFLVIDKNTGIYYIPKKSFNYDFHEFNHG